MKNSVLFTFVFTHFLFFSCNSQSTNQEYVPFVKSGAWGLANWNGNIVFEPLWEKPLTNYYSNLNEHGLYSFLNPEGITVLHAPTKKEYGPFLDVRRSTNIGLICSKGDKKGLINRNGEMILPCSFRNIIGNLRTNYFILTNTNGKNALWKHGDNLPDSYAYDQLKNIYFIDSISNAYIAKKNNHFGVLDNKGNVLIPFEYEKIKTLWTDGSQNNVFLIIASKVEKNGNEHMWIYNPDGNLIKEGQFNDIKAYSQDFIGICESDRGCSLYNGTLKTKIADSLRQGLSNPRRLYSSPIKTVSFSKQKGGTLYFDIDGKQYSKEEYEYLTRKLVPQYPNGEIIEINKKRGFISHSKDTLIPATNYNVMIRGDNLIVTFNRDNPANETMELYLSDGSPTGLSGKFIESIFMDPAKKKYPYIRISRSDETIYRNLDGSKLLDFDYERAVPELLRDNITGENLLVIKAKINGLSGIWDDAGTQLIPPKYDDVKTFIGSKLFIVVKNGEQFVVNSDGKLYN